MGLTQELERLGMYDIGRSDLGLPTVTVCPHDWATISYVGCTVHVRAKEAMEYLAGYSDGEEVPDDWAWDVSGPGEGPNDPCPDCA